MIVTAPLHAFAYGSNLNREDFEEWCDESGRGYLSRWEPVPAVVRCYVLVFDIHSGRRGRTWVANLRGDPRGVVHGALLPVDEADLRNLDAKESFRGPGARNIYERTLVDVEGSAGMVRAWAYLGTPTPPPPGDPAPYQPTRHYLDLIVSGARACALPEEWVAWLAAREAS